MQNIVNVECAVIRQNEWLMTKRSSSKRHGAGLLAFPGGKVETTDGRVDVLESCVKREVFEEVGLELTGPINYVASTSFFIDEIFVVNILFRTFVESLGAPLNFDNEEVEAVFWMTDEDIRRHPLTPPWLIQSLEHLSGVSRC